MSKPSPEVIRDAVRERYASAALAVQDSSCCADVGAGLGFGSELYHDDQAGDLPAGAVAASLGCGNPTMLATLKPGQVVLDLGSGGGIDVLLSARRVGPTGKVYGLDMTPEMLELARQNQAEAGVENVEFLLGTIEDIPLPDQSVDVIISNCVINLSADKDQVLREAHRVLRPGGLFAVSDVVLRRPISPRLQGLMALWTGCIAGALVDGGVPRHRDPADAHPRSRSNRAIGPEYGDPRGHRPHLRFGRDGWGGRQRLHPSMALTRRLRSLRNGSGVLV